MPTRSSQTSLPVGRGRLEHVDQILDALVLREPTDETDHLRVSGQIEPLAGLGPGRELVVGESGHVDAVARPGAEHLAAALADHALGHSDGHQAA